MYINNRREERKIIGHFEIDLGLWATEQQTLKFCKFLAVFSGDFLIPSNKNTGFLTISYWLYHLEVK